MNKRINSVLAFKSDCGDKAVKKTKISESRVNHMVLSSKSKERAGASSFQTFQFNIKQISELLGISRTSIYQLEKSKTIKGTEVSAGVSTKRVFSWDDMKAIVESVSEKVVRPKKKKIKVFANLKGGVGKSSISSQVAMRASAMGLKTLLIDLDPQAHATLALGFEDAQEEHPTILNCIVGKPGEKIDLKEAIIEITPFLSLIPANLSLSTLEAKLNLDNRRTERLKNLLHPIRDEWDLIVIDTNPSASLLNINALLAADEVCVVCATDFLSVTGLKSLFTVIDDLSADFPEFDPDLKVIPNLYDIREAIAQESLGVLRQKFGEQLTNTVVRKNVDLKEAQKGAQAVWIYNRKSPAAEDIIALTDELVHEA